MKLLREFLKVKSLEGDGLLRYQAFRGLRSFGDQCRLLRRRMAVRSWKRSVELHPYRVLLSRAYQGGAKGATAWMIRYSFKQGPGGLDPS